MTITSPTAFLDVGFDISHNNGQIDFAKLWVAGRRAVWLKATEGTTFTDPMFRTYLQQIVDSGQAWKVAAYHFAHGEDPVGQVDFFLGAVGDAMAVMNNPPSVLYMLDCERGNNPPDPGTVFALVDEMTNMGIPNPMNYGGYDFFPVGAAVMEPCSCMLAEYGTHPISPLPWRRPDAIFGWDWWQYTGDGLGPWAKDLAGGSHNMDLSCFNTAKHPEGLDAWWAAELAKSHPLTTEGQQT